jgi:spore maturation protein CgeB
MKRGVIIGGAGGTNIGESLKAAALSLALDAFLIDHQSAFEGPKLFRRALWAAGRRPYKLRTFSKLCFEQTLRVAAHFVIGTGTTPLTRETIDALRQRGVYTINVSTDDPWNPAHRARWFLDALPSYDLILTPRHANISDFLELGCRDVRYLPFGYDDTLFKRPAFCSVREADPMVLFVGGADMDRAAFFRDLRASGCRLTLAGSYWERFPDLSALSLGQLPPSELTTITANAAVNLCLVRRANRDGHVMRSFEIAAVGGFMVAEDTEDHRRLFGQEGECVLYFGSPEEAAQKAQWALSHPAERRKMADACHRRITTGQHTYRERLREIIEMVPQ